MVGMSLLKAIQVPKRPEDKKATQECGYPSSPSECGKEETSECNSEGNIIFKIFAGLLDNARTSNSARSQDPPDQRLGVLRHTGANQTIKSVFRFPAEDYWEAMPLPPNEKLGFGRSSAKIYLTNWTRESAGVMTGVEAATKSSTFRVIMKSDLVFSATVATTASSKSSMGNRLASRQPSASRPPV